MTFSIARYRHLQPSPPCLLGGEFLRYEERYFIKDAQSRFELRAPVAAFAGLRDGDLIVVHVIRAEGDRIDCDEVSCVVRAARPREAAVGGHSARFAQFVRAVRDFFVHRGLQEIYTPTLVRCPGLEPSLEPFPVTISRARETRTVYLPTSPEIHLKMILSRGWTDIFEIKPCFRKHEFSQHHEPEFTMLEWYRSFADLGLIREDLQALLDTLKDRGFVQESVRFEVTTFARLFAEILRFKLTPHTTDHELRDLCLRGGVHCTPGDSFNDLFHRLLIDRVEPEFQKRGPLLVQDFPPSQAALARLTREGWADRFEFYWNGLEIANAFNEVNDPLEQRTRWTFEQNERVHLGTSSVPQDPELIMALERGMPPAGGIALGVERLYMACVGVKDIRDLRQFTSADLFK